MTAAVPAGPRRGAKRPGVEAIPRPQLSAVPPLRPSRKTGLLAGFVIALMFGVLLGAVMLNSKLITGQQELDRLDRDIARSEAAHERLRLRVAELESPEHIVSAAQDRGMVPAASTVWVIPVVPTGGAVGAGPAPAPPAPTPGPDGPQGGGAQRAVGADAAPTRPAQP